MAGGRPSWYPQLEPGVTFGVKEAFRNAFDYLYLLRDNLSPLALIGRGLESQEISTTAIAVNGCNVTIPRGGRWLVTGNFTINVIGDSGELFSGVVVKRGTAELVQAQLEPPGDMTITISQQWVIACSQGEVLGLSIVKAAGGGTSTVDGLNSTITAAWAGE